MMTEELEARLRNAIARTMAQIEVPAQLVDNLVDHQYRLRRSHRRPVAALSVLVAVGVTASLLSIGPFAGSRRTDLPRAHLPRTDLTVASYTLRLPSFYHLTSSSSTTCRLHVVLRRSSPSASMPAPPSYAPEAAAAARVAGGCILMELAAPYTPTASLPDPEAIGYDLRPVTVGPYHGLMHTHVVFGFQFPRDLGKGPHGAKHPGNEPSRVAERSGDELYVEVPVAGGELRDLVVSETGLARSTFLHIVVSGLLVRARTALGNLPPGTALPRRGAPPTTSAALENGTGSKTEPI